MLDWTKVFKTTVLNLNKVQEAPEVNFLIDIFVEKYVLFFYTNRIADPRIYTPLKDEFLKNKFSLFQISTFSIFKTEVKCSVIYWGFIIIVFKSVLDSVADPGCLSRIPDPTFFHPGSE